MVIKSAASLYIFSTILISHYTWGTKYNKLIAVLLFLAVIIERMWKKRRLFDLSSQHVFFLFWCMLATLAGLLSQSQTDVMESTISTLQVFIASIPLFMILVDRECLKWISWTIVAAAIAAYITVSLGILSSRFAIEGKRFEGTLQNSNLFAFVSLVGVNCLIYLWSAYQKRLIKIIILIAGCLLSYQIILAGSRKGVIGIFLIFMIQYFVLVFKKKQKVKFKNAIKLLLVFVFLSSVFSYFLFTSQYGYRMKNLIYYLRGTELEKGEHSISGRAYLAKIGFKMFEKSPFIGTGLSSFEDSKVGMSIFTEAIGSYSHSNFIEVLVSSGAIGFLFYYAIYFSLILKVILILKNDIDEHNKSILYFVITGIAILLFYELFAVTYNGKEFWIFLSCIIASVKTVNKKITNEIDKAH